MEMWQLSRRGMETKILASSASPVIDPHTELVFVETSQKLKSRPEHALPSGGKQN